jgi:hypothetical protein
LYAPIGLTGLQIPSAREHRFRLTMLSHGRPLPWSTVMIQPAR